MKAYKRGSLTLVTVLKQINFRLDFEDMPPAPYVRTRKYRRTT